MTAAHRPALLVAALLMALPCHAGGLAYDFGRPVTSDRDSCGAMDEPLTDFDHYRVVLYRCTQDSLVRRTPPLKSYWIARRDSIILTVPGDKDSVRWTGLPDGMHGWAQVYSVDRNGLISCRFLSDVWATKAVAAPPPPPPPPPSDGTGIVGRYYRGLNRGEANYLGQRRDTTIAFTWGTGSPWPGTVPADSFSVEWDGEVYIPTAGAWTFYVTSEDGIQFYIDWSHGIDAYVMQPVTERARTATLTQGWHDLHLNYMARLGNSECTLRWSGPGVAKTVVPRGALR